MDSPALTRGKDWLESGDVRLTKQRLALAEVLVGDGNNRHVTAEGLHALTGKGDASVSLATVYNTLRTFCDAGLMSEITVDGSKSYFDTCTEEHPHYYVEPTGHLMDAPSDAVDLKLLKSAPEGMEISRVDVVIRLRESR